MEDRKVEKVWERYGKIREGDREFDIAFWQSEGPKAIFDAALGMAMDSLRLRGEPVDEPKIQRTVESFPRIEAGRDDPPI